MKLKLLVCVLFTAFFLSCLLSCTKDPDLYAYLTASQEEEVVDDELNNETGESGSTTETTSTETEGSSEGGNSTDGETSSSEGESSSESSTEGEEGSATEGESSSSESTTSESGEGSTTENGSEGDSPSESGTDEGIVDQGEETSGSENTDTSENTTSEEQTEENTEPEIDLTPIREKFIGEWIIKELRYDEDNPNSNSLQSTNNVIRSLEGENCPLIRMTFDASGSSSIYSKFNYLEIKAGPSGFYVPCPEELDVVPQAYEINSSDILSVLIFNVYAKDIPFAFEGDDVLVLDGAEVVLVLNGDSLFDPDDYVGSKVVFERK